MRGLGGVSVAFAVVLAFAMAWVSAGIVRSVRRRGNDDSNR